MTTGPTVVTELLDQLVADEFTKELGVRQYRPEGAAYGDAQVGTILRGWAKTCERMGVDEESLVTVLDIWAGLKLTDVEIRRRLQLHMVQKGDFIPVTKVKRGNGYRWGYPEPEALRVEADRLRDEADALEAEGLEDEAKALRKLEKATREKVRLVRMIRYSAGVINRNKVTGRVA